MDHEQIDRLGYVDLYLMGRLPPEESARFEEHFVDCPRCVARLQTTKNFLEDLRGVAAAQASRATPGRAGHGSRRFRRTLTRRATFLAAVCLLITAVAAAAFVVNHTRRLRAEVAWAKEVAEQWEHRFEDERQRATAADRERQEADSQQAERLSALEGKLAEAEAQHAALVAEFSRRMPAAGHLPIFALNSVRSGGAGEAEAGKRVVVPRSALVFALSVLLEGAGPYDQCRGTIVDDRHRHVWSGGLPVDSEQDALFAWFNSALFRPGHYVLMVEGVKRTGGWEVVGNYPFMFVRMP